MVVIVVTGSIGAQDHSTVADFSKSPTEHIINRIEQPFLVRAVRGTVIRREGFRELLANVLFEIQGPGMQKKKHRATTDGRGRFRIARASVGTYRFKVTLNGFQSVMGTIIVSKDAPKTAEIKIEMPVGV